MRSRRGKRKAAPAIVPRFLKNAVTIGAIPALAAACEKPRQVQPVVAYFAPPSQEDANGTRRPPPPVVAAYQVQPVVAAYVRDAAAVQLSSDAAVPPAVDAARPPPPVVAAMMPDPGPAVVAAYVPRDQIPIGTGSGSAAKKPKKRP
jgi:hypothetical protein